MSKLAPIVFGLVVFSMLPVSAGIASGTSLGQQDDETSSRREASAIRAVESAGGRVSQISAADTSKEVSFYLSSQPIADPQIKDVAAISEVIWMNLAGSKISNDGLKSLTGMPLTKLHLEKTGIGDAGLQHLKSLKHLEYLNLYETQVTDAGLMHLAELKNLKKLYVWKTAVTEAGMKKLNEALPDLEIVGEVKLETIVIEDPQPAKEEAAKKDAAKEVTPPSGKAKEDKTKSNPDAPSKDSPKKDSPKKDSPSKEKTTGGKK